MNPDSAPAKHLIWATRGRRWGFRFLLDAGMGNPLSTYETVFEQLGDSPTAFGRAGQLVALRFPDPEGRRDTARRVIPHEFVVAGDLADSIDSVAAGVRVIWPLVADIYSRVWDADNPPSREELEGSS